MEEKMTLFMCGGKCNHDWTGWHEVKDARGQVVGGSQACAKCGILAIDHAVRSGE